MNDPELRSPFLRRLTGRQLIGLDAAVAVFCTLLLLSFAGRPDRGAGPAPAAIESLVVAATGLPLAVRRLWPVPVLVAVFVMALLSLPLQLPREAFAALAYALYPVALTAPRRRWIPTPLIGGLSVLVLFGGAIAGPKDWQAEQTIMVLLGLAVLGGSWTLGRAVRERRAHATHSARQLADRAVTGERLRIARELHDVVAHSMSLIAVKAGVAVHVAEARPEEALDALRVIESTSRSTLTEMRHLLGVLRTAPGDDSGAGDAPVVTPEADLAPAPGLAGLAGIAERAAMAGVRVDLRLSAADLPEGVAMSAYRIVQEAVTNVVKHAAPAHCRVLVESDGKRVRIEVDDDGPGVRVLPGGSAPSEGHGLIGMRERVMMYGGAFTAGPRPEGGFAVSASLPYEPGSGE
ncbi:sensor histidine kinase [Actinomadura xylanilytica]|uniref:sensor histidine kinase n=1 Tax=Actinomadura xylanilytica TaxID=887459 RepID=UPI00255A74E9|nr:sensor histidine kinase [Actinomadura xylanilytica]MDL4770615.1 sensor histidine kinase [Actinomadura xylanilytica]